MSSAVAELDNTLSSMLATKAGVSTQKIQAITSLCNANVKDEAVLIQKFYAHFKKTEPSKKLGVLYAIDSVTRQWVEQARKAGQAVHYGARDGTYAAGVMHVSELLPALMHDISSVIPDEQRDKVHKLISIWESAGTFPMLDLKSFREKLEGPAAQSTTPTGTPPPKAILSPQVVKPATNPTQSTSSILASLQALAAATKGVSSQPAPVAPPALPAAQQYQAPPAVPIPPPVNASNNTVQYGNYPPPPPPVVFNPVAQIAAPPPPVPSVGQDNTVLQQQIMILQTLQAQGIPQSEWPKILAALATTQTTAPAPPPNFPAPPINQTAGAMNSVMPAQTYSGGNGSRSRSRSPRRDGGSSAYGRQRSPVGNDRRRGQHTRNGSNQQSINVLSSNNKWVDFDRTIPKNHIKVLSRTLFVGGVDCSDQQLKEIFSQAGQVQTCIVTPYKRHAFVKMANRSAAVKAKNLFEHYISGSLDLRTRWGVGFGPRECSDYNTGISIIPLEKLTDADRKWMVSSEHGGTGGHEIEAGIVVEEPDIEIGGGVSSKAISRRMATDKSGAQGPKSGRPADLPHNNNQNNRPQYQQNFQYQNNNQQKGRRYEHRGHAKDDPTPNVQVPPTVPSFGFQLPQVFTMPGALNQQPGGK